MSRFNLTIDPGADLGWALWNRSTWKKLVRPWKVGTVNGKGKTWKSRCDYTISAFNETMRGVHWGSIVRVWCEYPAFFGSHGGQTSARRGDLVKLAVIVGRLEQLCFTQRVERFKYVEIMDWKGQLSKKAVNEEIADRLSKDERTKAGMSPNQSHDWDAVGIGLHVKGVWL